MHIKMRIILINNLLRGSVLNAFLHGRNRLSDHSEKPFPLSMADEGAKVRIKGLQAGRSLTLRLTELGLNVGAEIRIIQRQGSGLLLSRGESRIAIGGGMAAKILVAPA